MQLQTGVRHRCGQIAGGQKRQQPEPGLVGPKKCGKTDGGYRGDGGANDPGNGCPALVVKGASARVVIHGVLLSAARAACFHSLPATQARMRSGVTPVCWVPSHEAQGPFLQDR